MMRRLGALAASLALAGCAHAPVANSQVSLERRIILVSEAPGGEVAAYAVFVNDGPATAVVEAECDCSERLELHLVRQGEGMAADWPLPLPAGSRIPIEPPGIPRHMMAVDLLRPIGVGEEVTIRFRLADGSWIAGQFRAVESSVAAWEAFERVEQQPGAASP
jgi:copper(I)-binding protein